jgi:serine/threonine protein kinase/TolB-like protein/Flp pilus assembly protein TadD
LVRSNCLAKIGQLGVGAELPREGEPSSRHPRSVFPDDFQLCTELRSAASVEEHGGGAGKNAEYIAAVLTFFDVTMNPGGTPAWAPLREGPIPCAECGSTSRVARGLCLNCLLCRGLGADTFNNETLEDVLAEVDVRDPDRRLGNYQILDEIAHGGMGVIYRARQRHSRRIVALKSILAYQADSRETLIRFRREALAAASLDHPNILPIYEVGEDEDGLPFFSMKFAAGGSLRDVAPALRSEPFRSVALMAKIARAVQYAHAQGILHRDLKPGNILLDGRGEPLVSDFGLAKWLDTASDLTRTLTIFGTPGYVAPEQAEGSTRCLRPSTDVYSLGAILFYLLTGRPPFLGDNVLAVIQQAVEKPAPKLRSVAPALDRDLEIICAKCLEREPNARYCSAGDLAEDLERWLADRPIIARPVSVPVRISRWSRRNPAAAGMAVLLLALGIGIGIMTWESGLLRRPANIAIAVMPFENLSQTKESAFFADTIQDGILTKLGRVADLRVLSRTSVMAYHGARNARQIGRALNVSYLLKGSVRWEAGRIHLSAQLIDTRTDNQVWAEEYDQDLANVFLTQSEIAKAVADQLEAKVSDVEKAAIEEPPTSDFVAYDFYLRARDLLLTLFSSRARAELIQAADLLNQAVARDPSFFQAYFQLAYTHDQLYFLGFDHSPARLALAEAAIQAAFRLRPEAGETHLARAENLYRGYLDYEGALAELAAASQTLPNSPRLFALKGYIERRQGRWEESTRNLERAIDLDPRDFFTLQQIAISYGVLRRYAQEKSVLDRALSIAPDDVDTKVARASVEFHWKADTQSLHQTIDSIRVTDLAALPSIANDWLSCALAERDVSAAKDALNAFGEIPLTDYAVHLNRPLIEGVIARMANDDETARAAFTVARVEQEKAVQTQPNYGPPLCVLGLIDAALGRKEEALREGRRAVELLPVEKDAINGPLMIAYLAMIAAWVGEKDLACEQLAIAVRPPSTVSYGQLKLLPFWDPLRKNPCFEKIVASLAPKETAPTRPPAP